MSADTDPTRSAAADAAAAPLDLLLTAAATGMLRRVNPASSGLRLAVALAARPRLVSGQAVLDAMDALARITGSEQTALAGACSGGIIAAMVAAHLAHAGQQERIAAVTLMVTVLDQARAGLASAVIDERTARLAAAASRARGYLDGRSLAEVFAWLRPNDLIWNYWVNNYLLGRKPPPFDILFWNADTTRICPDRVRRLVLVATGPGALMVPGHPRVLLRMLTPRRHRDPGHAARIAGELYGGSARQNPALARDLMHATARSGRTRGYHYQLLSCFGWTSLPLLPRLRPPALILAGDDDPIIPLVNARIMNRLIPRSQLHIYHGGHLELGAAAERIAPVVEAFPSPGGAENDTGH